MKRWPTKPLEEIAEVFGGSTPSRDNPSFWGGEIHWVTPTDLPMPDGGISVVSKTKDRITQAGLDNSSATVVPKGTVLFSSRATIGKVAVANIALTTNQGFANFVPHAEVTSRFLAYALWVYREDIARLSGSTTFKEVSRSTLRKYQVPVPPLAEQERIVKLLDEADELRKLRAQADSRTADLIPALFHEMFGEKSVRKVPLIGITANERNSLANGPFGSDLLSSELTGSGVPVIYIRDISAGRYRRKSTVYVTPAKAAALEFCNAKPGDVLVAKVGTPPGIAAVYPANEPHAIVTQDVIRIRPNVGLVLSVYLEAFLNSSLGRREVRNITIQATRERFSLGQFKQIEVPLPPLPRQNGFALRVTEIREFEAVQAASRHRLDELFQSLLYRAFDGDL